MWLHRVANEGTENVFLLDFHISGIPHFFPFHYIESCELWSEISTQEGCKQFALSNLKGNLAKYHYNRFHDIRMPRDFQGSLHSHWPCISGLIGF